MEAGGRRRLVNAEIHGFHTAADLAIEKLKTDAKTRWFRPNEVHAILSNHELLRVEPQPVQKPPSGTVLLFDRKVLRNFRKDGHDWKKKKDGKTVQEAHEKLKVGNEETIHVYYARGENDPNFYRRSYWLLDKNLERIVLVHYRQTSEDGLPNLRTAVDYAEALSVTNRSSHGSPITPMVSSSASAHSEGSGSAIMSEEINSGVDNAIHTELQSHQSTLHDINTLEWQDLVEIPAPNYSTLSQEGAAFPSLQHITSELRNSAKNVSFLASCGTVEALEGVSPCQLPIVSSTRNGATEVDQTISGYFQALNYEENESELIKIADPNCQTDVFKINSLDNNATLDNIADDILLSENSFGQGIYMNTDRFSLLDHVDRRLDIDKSDIPALMDQSSTQKQSFNITDISPGWAYSTEETKVLVVGHFHEQSKHLMESNIHCVFGEKCVAAEMVQPGVYRCMVEPQIPGTVDFFLTLDGQTPISQIVSFDYRSKPNSLWNDVGSSADDSRKLSLKDLQMKMRLAHLLFSTTRNISSQSNKIPPKFLKEAKSFASKTSPLIQKFWSNLLTLGSGCEPSSEDLFEMILKNKLQEWLLEKVAEGCKTTAHDSQGQGVIHLCAILDYTWSVYLFSSSGLSLDFRDAYGWAALHWAAYYGRQNMVAALLSAGANPSLVTDPTAESPGGYTPADLAAKQGYEGLAAYLAEKGLTAHFHAMSLSGNIAPVTPTSNKPVNPENVNFENLSEQELCLKESLTAYRNAADAASCIQAAFRERSLKLQTKEVQLSSPVMEASQIVAALKIQHAFQNYKSRRMMKAAARIQSQFRTRRIRNDFLNMRKQAIRIQAAFRGHQVRKQYHKILWSVGILEKAILRWRLKRKGLRGIQVESTEAMRIDAEPGNIGEEEFYRISQGQAEERVTRSVVRVQAMFRSYRAQQEYRRMKLVHEQAKLEFDQLSQNQ
ncbi:calmodulin-binding transcription activator CBT [Typha angustifolia]|uniref:calmodulin-binding transcription activator CBT n=1 Tax=Typha angustifolia TaxID=59011 RepID=UPI003C305222